MAEIIDFKTRKREYTHGHKTEEEVQQLLYVASELAEAIEIILQDIVDNREGAPIAFKLEVAGNAEDEKRTAFYYKALHPLDRGFTADEIEGYIAGCRELQRRAAEENSDE